jgi:hypothetical protein
MVYRGKEIDGERAQRDSIQCPTQTRPAPVLLPVTSEGNACNRRYENAKLAICINKGDDMPDYGEGKGNEMRGISEKSI